MKRRQQTQLREQPWPFLYSVVPGRPGLTQNVPAPVKPEVKRKTIRVAPSL